MLENALNTYRSTLRETVIPFLRKRSAGSYITFAVILVAVQQVYSTLRVPKKYRKFPSISVFSMIKSFYYKESVAERTRKLITPLMKDGHKFYVSRVPLTWTVFTVDPVAAKTLLMKTDNFPKSHAIFDAVGSDSPSVKLIGTDSVPVANGEVWKKQRRIMNPAFHRSMPVNTMSSMIPRLYAYFENEDPQNGEIFIEKAMKNFTLDVLGLAVFGFDFQAMKGDPQGWTKTYDIVVESVFNPWINIFAKVDFLVKYISAARRRSIQATDAFNNMLEDLIDKKRQEIISSGVNKDIPENEKDLLTLMLEADAYTEGDANTITELRHNVAVFFLAGHDTTANTLSLCLYHLAQNKHVQRKARAEVLEAFGDDKNEIFPTAEELKGLEYINMVLKENLRINGPADVLMTRNTKEDIELNGTIITKGTDISVDVTAIQMNPVLWKNPEHFIPERFEKGGEHDGHSGLTWIPFSNGSRQCIGMQFSLAEQRLVLANLLRKYEIDLPKDSIHEEKIIFDDPKNFAPKSLKLKFTKRY